MPQRRASSRRRRCRSWSSRRVAAAPPRTAPAAAGSRAAVRLDRPGDVGAAARDDVADVDRLGRVAVGPQDASRLVVDLDGDAAAGRAATRPASTRSRHCGSRTRSRVRPASRSTRRRSARAGTERSPLSRPRRRSTAAAARRHPLRQGRARRRADHRLGEPQERAADCERDGERGDSSRKQRERRRGDDDPERRQELHVAHVTAEPHRQPLKRIQGQRVDRERAVVQRVAVERLERQHEQERHQERHRDAQPRPRQAVPEPDDQPEQHRRQRVEAVALDDVLGHARGEDPDLEQHAADGRPRPTATNDRSASVLSRPATPSQPSRTSAAAPTKPPRARTRRVFSVRPADHIVQRVRAGLSAPYGPRPLASGAPGPPSRRRRRRERERERRPRRLGEARAAELIARDAGPPVERRA